VSKKKIAVIGGGAAGFFFAINCAEKNPDYEITILEKAPKLLEKVRISGGGRCNVTHACFDAKLLSKNYPRGEKELLGPFHAFAPTQTIEWFANRDVKLKTESDDRMFPVTDSSETIIDCFMNEAKKHHIKIRTLAIVDEMKYKNELWHLVINKNEKEVFDAVLIASGSAHKMWDILAALGHKVIAPVSSLFTFNIKDSRIKELMGLSVKNATVSVIDSKLSAQGPVLITHWGLSGPAILRVSAWGARALHERNHRFELMVNWCGEKKFSEVLEQLKSQKSAHHKKVAYQNNLFEIPLRLWQSLWSAAEINEQKIWADCNNKELDALANQLTKCTFQVTGKSTNKDEFVTAGGVDLREVDFKTMQSKLLPNLYFGGEVMNIDAITGGFNFQAAWTTAWIAAQSV
jgi:predicted Rossmann fold flavoprotein